MQSVFKHIAAVCCAGVLTAFCLPPLPAAAEDAKRVPVRPVLSDFNPEGENAVFITAPKKEHINVLITRENAEGETEILYRSNELHAYRNGLYYLLEPGEYDLSVSAEPVLYAPATRTYTKHIVIEESNSFTHTEYRYKVSIHPAENTEADQPEAVSVQEHLTEQVKYIDSTLVFPRYDILQGDYDNNGIITALDAQQLLKFYAESLTGEPEELLTPAQLAACDIDGNDKITAVDAQWILVYYLDSMLESEPVWPYSTYTEHETCLYATGKYQKDQNAIEISWISNDWPDTVDVLISPDGEAYTVAASVSDSSVYSYPVDDDFVSAYFKVTYTDDDGKSVSSIPFFVDAKNDGITVDYPDSDGDGISDILESLYGTDADTDDTDGDGLSDSEEITITKTDPKKADTALSGVSDAEADSDGDGVVNRLEIEYGTDPLNADSDGDGLTDSRELSAHTDPLNADSDADGLEDSFEIRYGLNPLSGTTDGTADAERRIEQIFDADSALMQTVNTEESPYEMSVEVTAKGDAEKGLSVQESDYAAALENDAQVGDIIDLSVSDFLSAETVRLNFTVKEDYRDNTLNKYAQYEDMQGIKRLSVFRYYSEINMMLPVETQQDTENNRIFSDVSEPGTYCVMDLEIWFDLFGLDPDKIENQDEQTVHSLPGRTVSVSLNSRFSAPDMRQPVRLYADTSPNKIHNAYPIDIVFILQTTVSKYDEQAYPFSIGVMEELAEYVFDRYSDVRVYVVQYDVNSEKVVNFGSTPYCTDAAAFSAGIEAIPYSISEDDCRTKSALQLAASLDLRGSTNTYFYHVINGNFIAETDYDGIVLANSGLGIYSQIMPDTFYWSDDGYFSSLHNAIVANGGIDNFLTINSTQELTEHFSETVDSTAVNEEYQILLGVSLHKVKLKTVLGPENGTNSDWDSLTDWEEADSRYIKSYPDGGIQLPTLEELSQKAFVDLEEILSKSGGGYAKTRMIREIQNREVLPCISDPTKTDTDSDNLDDAHDHLPLIPADSKFKFCEPVDYETIPEVTWVNERKVASENDYMSKYQNYLDELNSLPLREVGGLTEVVLLNIITDSRAGVSDLAISTLTSIICSFALELLDDSQFRLGNIGPLSHAPQGLEHFCAKTGTPLHFSEADTCELISSSVMNLEHMAYNLTKAMQYSEQAAQEDTELYFTSTPDANLKVTCFDNKGHNCIFVGDESHNSPYIIEGCRHGDRECFSSVHIDWHNTVGESFGGIRAKISRSGTRYTMQYRYCMYDIYEWTPTQITKCNAYTLELTYGKDNLGTILHFLHQAGFAREFLMDGSFEGTITWEEGAAADDKEVFDQIVNTMKKHEGLGRWEISNCYDEFINANDPDYRNPRIIDGRPVQ